MNKTVIGCCLGFMWIKRERVGESTTTFSLKKENHRWGENIDMKIGGEEPKVETSVSCTLCLSKSCLQNHIHEISLMRTEEVIGEGEYEGRSYFIMILIK